MRLDEAGRLATRLMSQHGLRGWRFEFDRSKRRFGLCHYWQRRISLSAILTEANGEAEV